MRVLVTGGAGRLGIRLCDALLEQSFQVRILDLDNAVTRKNLKYLKGKPEIVWGDITETDSVGKALRDVDAVVHMATTMTSLGRVEPETVTKVNVGGTRILVDQIKKNGQSIPFVYTSSVVVFGPTQHRPEPLNCERDYPKPKGIYAQTKFEAEEVIRSSGIDYVILRLASGWQNSVFTRKELKVMFNMPLNSRIEICHTDEMNLAIINSIRNFDTVKGNTLIVSSGVRGRIVHQDRVRAVMKVLGLPEPPVYRFNTVSYQMDWYDTERAEELLHFQHKTFAECIQDYRRELMRRNLALLLLFMRYFIGPVFGKLIVRFI